ncbi:trypsin-like peptidase domain-containing protein [Streptomyces sp. NPDC000345]|uniref:nSTAND1 domain-containing NTPase n=1 Tax=Streptomyces sp. NPDC000345 TaxID=3364537 RepID=UPI0036AFAF6D
MAQVLSATGRVVGAGFLCGRAGDEVVLTCAHVIEKGEHGPGSRVLLVFPQAAGAPRVEGTVLADAWTDKDREDVAVIRLTGPVPGIPPLALGAAEHRAGHRLSTIGFPHHADPRGRSGTAVADGVLQDSGDLPVLQLREANSLTVGFSGAPLVDEATGLVLGMVRAITPPDVYQRGHDHGMAIPTETLRRVWPDLQVGSDVQPYRDLRPFEEGDARWFRGRAEAVDEVLNKLNASGKRGMLVVGPSGSGKSSLIRAGVLPRLKSSDFPRPSVVFVPRPGRDLRDTLDREDRLPGAAVHGIAAAVEQRMAAEPDCDRLILLIDQFEELLAHRQHDGAVDGSHAALRELTELITSFAPVKVVMIMRSDFLPRMMDIARVLLDAVGRELHLPSELSRDDLKAIITEPAAAAGATWDERLPDRITSDVLAATPGGAETGRAPAQLLPLLEITLLHLWENREDGRLVDRAYQGVTGSLRSWALRAMHQLPAEQQVAAQRMLTALVRRDEAGRMPDIRDRVPLSELRALTAHPAADDILAALVGQRLIVTTGPDPGRPDSAPREPYAELIHDRLVTDWGDLQDWVARDEQYHFWRRRIKERRDRWNQKGRRPRRSFLDGPDLEFGLQWLREGILEPPVDRFVKESRRHRLRRLTGAITALSILLVLSCGAMVVALVQLDQKQQALEQTQAAERKAVAKQLVAESEQLRRTNPWLALQLGIAAYRTDRDSQVRASLTQTVATTRLFGSTTGRPLTVTRDGGLVLARTVGTKTRIATWDTASTGLSPNMRTETTPLPTVLAARPDGRLLVTTSGGARRQVRLWAMGSGERPVPAGPAAFGADVATARFSPDGRRLAVGHREGTITVWDVSDPRRPTAIGAPFEVVQKDFYSRDVDVQPFSPDGRLIASATHGAVTLWEAGARHRRAAVLRLPSLPKRTDRLSPHQVHAVAFSPDGHVVAAATTGHVVLWNIADLRHPVHLGVPVLGGHNVTFSPDGKSVATSEEKGATVVWDMTTPDRPRRTDTFPAPQSGGANAVRFTPDGTRLVVGYHPAGSIAACGAIEMERDCRQGLFDSEYTVVWNLRSPVWPRTVGKTLPVTAPALAVSPDGRVVVTPGTDGRLVFRDLSSRVRLGEVRPGVRDQVITALAYRRDGKALAVAGSSGYVELWDITDMARPVRRATEYLFTGPITLLRYSGDGEILEAADGTYLVRWDTTSETLNPYGAYHRTPPGRVAFSPQTNTMARVKPRDPMYPTAGDGVSDQVELWPVLKDGIEGYGVAAVGPQPGSAAVNLHGPGSMGSAVEFTPEGDELAVGGGDGSLTLWHLDGSSRSEAHRRALPKAGHHAPVSAIAFSPDGSTVVTGAADGTLLIWTLGADSDGPFNLNGVPRAAHDSPILATAFTPDGSTLLTVGSDGALKRWDLAALTTLHRAPDRYACDIAGAALSKEVWRSSIPSLPYTRTCP